MESIADVPREKAVRIIPNETVETNWRTKDDGQPGAGRQAAHLANRAKIARLGWRRGPVARESVRKQWWSAPELVEDEGGGESRWVESLLVVLQMLLFSDCVAGIQMLRVVSGIARL